uniref:Uncharacterized protein n=1 Tax=Sphaerodactylus townsendi TaxID=933632 RepID=A0ACB8E5W8_9SAUR
MSSGFCRKQLGSGELSDFSPLFSLDPNQPQQQKRHTPGLQGNLGGEGGDKTDPQPARHKMKLLLPRVNSYLVPVQFPLSQALVTLPVPQSTSELVPSCKRVRIAPKVLPTSVKPTLLSPEISIKEEVCCEEESSSFASLQSTKEDTCQINKELFPASWSIKEERDKAMTPSQSVLPVEEPPTPWEEEPEQQMRLLAALKQPSQETLDPKRDGFQEMSRSRRKQHLVQPHQEEPVLLLPPPPPSRSGSESFILQHSFPSGPEGHPPENISQGACGPFKTPIKEMLCQLPASSTPSKMPTATPSRIVTDPWRLVPLVKETSAQDCGPSRTPPMPLLALQQNLDLGPSMFDSPQPLLLNTEANDVVLGQLISSPASSNPSPPELQASVLSENCSLQEGLFLDTMNESLSKILLDASFPGFDEDSLATDLSWSGSFLV